MWSQVRATRASVKYNSERGFGPSRPKSWHFLQVASLEVIEAVARGTEGGRIGFTHRRFSFFGRLGDFNVAMRRLRHCPNGFPRFCNVAARGVAATLKSRHLRMRLWGFRHIVTLKGREIAREGFFEGMACVTPGVGVSLKVQPFRDYIERLEQGSERLGGDCFAVFPVSPWPIRFLYELGNSSLTGQALYGLVD